MTNKAYYTCSFLIVLFLIASFFAGRFVEIENEATHSYYITMSYDSSVSINNELGARIAYIDNDIFRHGDEHFDIWLIMQIETQIGYKSVHSASWAYYEMILNKQSRR